MQNNDLHLRLIAGKDVPIDGVGVFHQMRINDLIDLGETLYYHYLGALLFSKDALEIDDPEFNKLSDYEALMILLHQDKNFRELFVDAFGMMFHENLMVSAEHILYIGSEYDRVLTEEHWRKLQNVIRVANFFEEEKEEEIEAGNEEARKFMEQLKKRKKKIPKKKQKIDLHSLISSLCWAATKSMDEILNMTVYQIYDGYQRIEHKNSYHYTLTGIYQGTVDMKEINLSDINWANILNK